MRFLLAALHFVAPSAHAKLTAWADADPTSNRTLEPAARDTADFEELGLLAS
jgi:hypothetical protein